MVRLVVKTHYIFTKRDSFISNTNRPSFGGSSDYFHLFKVIKHYFFMIALRLTGVVDSKRALGRRRISQSFLFPPAAQLVEQQRGPVRDRYLHFFASRFTRYFSLQYAYTIISSLSFESYLIFEQM